LPGPSGDAGPAPVVHVTIGRIEVRAVPERPTAAAPVAAPRPRSPRVLSLDDYVRQRTGERDR
jgi:hypothetical protein